MQPRPRLRTIELTSARAVIRRITLTALPILAVVAALGYVLPAHRVEGAESFHSNFADGGPFSLFMLVGAAGSMYFLRNGRFGAGIGAGAIAIVGAVLALAPVLLVHFLRHVDHAAGESVFAIGELGLFFTGAASLIAEPILYLVERHRIVRSTLPAALPVARVFT